jgi:hypothetical protein
MNAHRDLPGASPGRSYGALMRTPLMRRRTRQVLIAGLLFMLTFAVYWVTGPSRSPYDFQLSQANNIVHGQLHLTEEYTRNLYLLERVLFDGEGFCLPTNDPRGPEAAAEIENPRITDDCRHYMQHSLGPALMLVPLVMVWGLDINQTLISIIFGGLTAILVWALVRHFTDNRRTRLALTALAIFGTTFWYSASDGGVWHYAHTTAVFFVFASIYATLVMRNPLLAGAMVGAAFMCRPTTILAGIFPLIMFSEQWFHAAAQSPIWQRIRLRPLVLLAAGVAPFVLLAGVLNMMRFGSPLESGYNYTEQLYQTGLSWRWPHGFFDISYVGRHIHVVFEQMPIFSTNGSFIWPSWAGLAMWVTTPPLFYALFIHLRRHQRVVKYGVAVLGVTAAFIALRGVILALTGEQFGQQLVEPGLHLLPFWVLIGGAIAAAAVARDRLVLACWATVVAIAFVDFLFAATGWGQFGYRYGLDFMPFLFVLIVVAVGRQVRRHHLVLIGLGVLVNLWGVLWIQQFSQMQLFDWTWVSF